MSLSARDWREFGLSVTSCGDAAWLVGMSPVELETSLMVSAPAMWCSSRRARGCWGSSRMSTCFKEYAFRIVSSSRSTKRTESHDKMRAASKWGLPLTKTLTFTDSKLSQAGFDSSSFLINKHMKINYIHILKNVRILFNTVVVQPVIVSCCRGC